MFDYEEFLNNMSEKKLTTAAVMHTMADLGVVGNAALEMLENPETKLVVLKDGDSYKESLNLGGAFVLANFQVDYETGRVEFGGVSVRGGSTNVSTMDMFGYWLPRYIPEGVVKESVATVFKTIESKLELA
ncbi:MAG: hypothetical protein LBM27_02875 [Lactobacillaceae bacterium]|jgi:hypothetical protein|nr:hypothetical protein [Lactobacillaceae bacterium]